MYLARNFFNLDLANVFFRTKIKFRYLQGQKSSIIKNKTTSYDFLRPKNDIIGLYLSKCVNEKSKRN
jgi:hypothetical protein